MRLLHMIKIQNEKEKKALENLGYFVKFIMWAKFGKKGYIAKVYQK